MSRVGCYWLSCYPDNRGENSPTDSGSSTVSVGNESGQTLTTSGLSITTTLSVLLSLSIVVVAVSTGQWLHTEEKIQRPVGSRNRPLDGRNISLGAEVKLTYSGLWKVCVTLGFNMDYECSTIDYFPKEEYSPDPSDSTMAIPYAVTKSAAFFLMSVGLLILAEICYFAGLMIRPKTSICVFAAGVTLIISGLLMLVGMVMYISVFKAEVGSKLRPRSSFQGPPFVYRYGYSFLLYVAGFIITEFAGTSAIFLHISWQQLELSRDRFKRKEANYDSYNLDNYHMHDTPQSNNTYRSYLCERHQKRYFYEHETPSDCQHHHNCFEYNDYLPTMQADCNHYQHGMTHDLTTETMSTIADGTQDEYMSSIGTPREFGTFDFGEHLPPLPENVRSNGWKTSSLRKTTPV